MSHGERRADEDHREQKQRLSQFHLKPDGMPACRETRLVELFDESGQVEEVSQYAYGNKISYEIVRQPQLGTKFSFKGDGLPTLEMAMDVDVGSTNFSSKISIWLVL